MLKNVVPPGRDVDQVDAEVRQARGQLYRLVRSPRLGDVGVLLEPVRGRDTHEQGHRLWHVLARDAHNLPREAGAVLQAPPVLVRPFVHGGRVERGKQVPVRRVDFDHVEPDVDCAAGRRGPGVLELVHLGFAYGDGLGHGLGEGVGRRAPDVRGPAANLFRRDGRPREPGRHGAGFAARVGQLDAYLLAL